MKYLVKRVLQLN